MPTILDSYSEANIDLSSTMDASGGVGHNLAIGQAFCTVKAQLDSAVFSLKKTGSPTGNAVVKLYAEAHTTAFGTNNVAFYVYGILSSTPGNVGRYVSVGNGMSRSEGAT